MHCMTLNIIVQPASRQDGFIRMNKMNVYKIQVKIFSYCITQRTTSLYTKSVNDDHTWKIGLTIDIILVISPGQMFATTDLTVLGYLVFRVFGLERWSWL